jgi:hypothetical protein
MDGDGVAREDIQLSMWHCIASGAQGRHRLDAWEDVLTTVEQKLADQDGDGTYRSQSLPVAPSRSQSLSVAPSRSQSLPVAPSRSQSLPRRLVTHAHRPPRPPAHSSAWTNDLCSLLVQSLLPPVAQGLSRHCEQARWRVVASACVASREFTKAFAGALFAALKGLRKGGHLACVGTCSGWLRASGEVVRACGGRADGMDDVDRQVVKGMAQGQEVVLGAMIKRGGRVGSIRSIRSALAGSVAENAEVLEAYVVYCTRKDASGYALVGVVWDAVRRRTAEDAAAVQAQVQARLFAFYMESMVTNTARKEAPSLDDIDCFAGVLGSLTAAQIEGEFAPAAVKMAKRSPEVSMAVACHGLGAMAGAGLDLSGCGEALVELVVQQAKHGKETVRALAAEMMAALARGTRDPGVVGGYGETVRDALLDKGAGKLKSPQERGSMATVLGAVLQGRCCGESAARNDRPGGHLSDD